MDVENLQKQLEHWKAEAEKLQSLYDNQSEEFDDFKLCSEEIEQELSASVADLEKANKNLQHRLTAKTLEFEALEERHEKAQVLQNEEISELRSENSNQKKKNDQLMIEIRELEQQNDNLERTNRMIVATLKDLEQRLEIESEKNALLESEVVEKQTMAITVQRLKDEARDLSEELHIKELKQAHENKENKKNQSKTPISSPTTQNKKLNKSLSSSLLQTPNNNNKKEIVVNSTPKNNGFLNGQNETPHSTPQQSPRVYALSIVGELLRKVGALETKLASCRNIVLDQSTKSTIAKINDSPKEKNNNSFQKLAKV